MQHTQQQTESEENNVQETEPSTLQQRKNYITPTTGLHADVEHLTINNNFTLHN